MKKDLYLLVVLMTLVSFFSLVACQKEGDGKILFTAIIETPSTQSKTSITNTGVMTWLNGDQIAVFDNGGNGVVSHLAATPTGNHKTADFTLVSGYEEPSDGPYYAIYPASIATTYNTITLPSEYTYDGSRFDAPMYAYSNNNQLVFKNLCGVMQLNLTANKSINSIVITTDQAIAGEFSLDYNGGNPIMIATQNNNGNTLTINFDNSVDCSGTGQSFYVYLPIGNYGEMSITIYATGATYCTKTLQSGQTFIVGHNTLNPLNFNNPQFRPIGSKGGFFSVGVNKKVWFSQGNLQYIGSATTPYWKFANNQYDIFGTTSGQNSSVANVDRDLFGFGTSGWNSGASCYMPWSTTASYDHYYPGGSFRNGLTGNYAEADWAWHNPIYNGGNNNHLWRTLTVDEWQYLLFNRTNASSKKGTGNIEGIGGLIILPDNWELPSGCTFTPGTSRNWALNNISLSQWSKMEEAGAVFMPAAGCREETDIRQVGEVGYYWSSTPYYIGNSAFCMRFISLEFNTVTQGRDIGTSVRPVRVNN